VGQEVILGAADEEIDARQVATVRTPNFFILGAPKCGTTSLATWLGDHPRIFVSKTKEPHFFNTDDKQAVATLAAYEGLFSQARDRHRAIGEASVWYLSSSVAVANILRYQPAARFIVMLRNPVEMAPALHAEMVLSGHENVRDFRTAWEQQDERRQGTRLPALTWAQRRLLYGEVCALGNQFQRLLSAVPRDRLLTILLDDIAADPRREYLRALQFLGVDDDGRVEFAIYNSARTLRWPHLNTGMFLMSQIKSRMGIQLNLNLWNLVSRLNTIETPREPLLCEMAEILRSYFACDVELLGRLLGRDLRHWLTARPDLCVRMRTDDQVK